MKNKVIVLLAVLLFTGGMLSHANESRLPEAPIYIDGKPITTKYIMRDGHLLVPALFIKHTGAYVDWDAQYRSVVFRNGSTLFALPVGKKYSDDFIGGIWRRYPLTVDSVEFLGEPFVPLIDVTRKLGMTARYDTVLNRTFITSNIAVKANHINRKNTSQKLVALTFDDGPDDYYTPRMLDILKEKGVPATFFVVGRQVDAFPSLMKRIVDEGHGIANHTQTHPNLRNQWSNNVRTQISSTQATMARVVGRRPDIFRPPYGSLTKADVAILNELGMKNIMWSVDTVDWSGASADEILKTVHRDITPGGIILQHNFQSNSRLLDGTLEALPRIIDELKARGYRFVTIQTLLAE
ncbi:MAG: polysaccharide deacetylase family protein [Bacillaceae bacterium]|nr:polysaccharide deacetylase family protein [Bacillaceae bacterium]